MTMTTQAEAFLAMIIPLLVLSFVVGMAVARRLDKRFNEADARIRDFKCWLRRR